MANVDTNVIQGLTDGMNALTGFALARTYIDQGELYPAAHSLGTSLEQLVDSERFWRSADYVIRTQPPAHSSIADFGESQFAKFEHEILTGSNPSYSGKVLSGPHAIDLISRVLPHSVALGPRLEGVGTGTRDLIKDLASNLREHANEHPGTEPPVSERSPRDGGSRFGRLIMGLGRGLLALAGAGIAGANAYVAIVTGDVTLATSGSMTGGIAAIGAAVYNAPEILSQALSSGSQQNKPDQSLTPTTSSSGTTRQRTVTRVPGGLIIDDVFVPIRE